MAYRFLNNWFVNEESRIAIKEPAIIINTDNWSVLYFGEASSLETILDTISPEVNATYIKFNLERFKPIELETIINDILFNKKYVKFQLLRLVRNSLKEENDMSFEKNNIKESTCDGCYLTAEEALENEDTLYACYNCDTALCLDCYKEQADMDDTEESAVIYCPECGERMYEITREDVEKPSLEEMFG